MMEYYGKTKEKDAVDRNKIRNEINNNSFEIIIPLKILKWLELFEDEDYTNKEKYHRNIVEFVEKLADRAFLKGERETYLMRVIIGLKHAQTNLDKGIVICKKVISAALIKKIPSTKGEQENYFKPFVILLELAFKNDKKADKDILDILQQLIEKMKSENIAINNAPMLLYIGRYYYIIKNDINRAEKYLKLGMVKGYSYYDGKFDKELEQIEKVIAHRNKRSNPQN
jgi:hypothetical protein